jgi:hypothetical protein
MTLKLVLLSDLVGEAKAGGVNLTLPAAGAVFDYFDFWVCTQCNRTSQAGGLPVPPPAPALFDNSSRAGTKLKQWVDNETCD